MSRYVVEASFPGVGQLTSQELWAVTRRAERVTNELVPIVRWQHAYVTADRLYLVYESEDEQQVRRHLERIGIVATRVARMAAAIDPTPAIHRRSQT